MYKYYSEVVIMIDEMIKEYAISSKSHAFYRGRIRSFFDSYMKKEVNISRPLNALTYYDIEEYLKQVDCSDADKINIYYALKRFFLYTYRKGLTSYFMHDVKKPELPSEDMAYIENADYEKLKDFIFDNNQDIKERLIIGLFLFTGLGRMFIYNVHTDDFVYYNGLYKLKVWKSEQEVLLPIKAELQLIIHEFLRVQEPNVVRRVINVSENYLSTFVSNLSKKITGCGYTPTEFSSTFIQKALIYGNYIWEISNLTLESIGTIEKHISKNNGSESRKLSILNSF